MSKTAADLLLECLSEWDVKHVHGFPGDGINGSLGAFGRLLCCYDHRLRSEGWQLTEAADEGESKWVVTPPRWFFHEAGAA